MDFTDKCVTAGTDKKEDVFIRFEIVPEQTENEIQIESKVAAKYGDHIQALVEDMLNKHGLTGVRLAASDLGALDFAWKARIETAILRWQKQEGRI